jgi:hypothetical protein
MHRLGDPMKSCLVVVVVVVVVLGLGLVLPAVAEVYRWTDANGQVHYGARPPPQGAERLDLPKATVAPATGDADVEARRARQRRLLESYEYERGQKEAEAERAAQQQQQNAQRCRELQRRWRRLSHPGPIYFGRADGGRDYLDDAGREAEKERMRPAYVQACGRQP